VGGGKTALFLRVDPEETCVTHRTTTKTRGITEEETKRTGLFLSGGGDWGEKSILEREKNPRGRKPGERKLKK